MLVTDDAKYCSRRSKVDLVAMSDRGDQKEVSKEEPTSVTSRAKQPVIKNSFDKKGQSSKAVRRRAYPIDAATAPVVIDAEESVAGVRREPPLIDAATISTSGKEGHCDTRANSDDELTSVSDVPEMTAEEDLLREVGLNDPS